MVDEEFEINTTLTKFRMDDAISFRRVHECVKELSPAKSSSCLEISSKLYIDALEVLTEQLTFLINLSLKTKVFPDAWKLAVVSSIPKKGDRSILGNSLPISLIRICGKIMEKIVNSMISSYLKTNELISKNQYGFVKNRSTTDCIGVLCHDLLHNINNNELTL